MAMRRDRQEYITYELVPTSPAVSYLSGSSNYAGVKNSATLWGVASWTGSILLAAFLCLLPWSFFSSRLVSVHVVHPYSSIYTIAAWKKLRFILSVRSDFHMTDMLFIAVLGFVSHVPMSFFCRWDTASEVDELVF